MERTSLILGIVLGGVLMFLLLRGLWHLGYFSLMNVLSLLRSTSGAEEEGPKSLSNMESMVLPRILKDYPDFDGAAFKLQAKEFLQQQYGDRPDFHIHNLVFSDYRRLGSQRIILLQAAVCWKEGSLLQKRLELHAELKKEDPGEEFYRNCPNCGATLGPKDIQCQYCGTRVPGATEERWVFLHAKEI